MVNAPFQSKVAAIGGLPGKTDDVASAIFLAIFIIGAILHMSLLIRNKRRGRSFNWQGPMFGFCMARITSTIMRIVWANREHNTRIALAAQIFFNAGVVLLYIVNMALALHLLESVRAFEGKYKLLRFTLHVTSAVVILSIAMLITTVIQQSYSLNVRTHHIDRDVQLAANTVFLVIACLPLLISIIAIIRRRTVEPTAWGKGRWRTKALTCVGVSVIAVWIATFRCGTAWAPVHLATDPQWYDTKWAFYLWGFGSETVIVYGYLVMRVDQRFHKHPIKPQSADEGDVYHSDDSEGRDVEKEDV